MKLFRHINDYLRLATKDLVLSIGNFDGVHLGHQQIIAILRSNAHTLQLPSGVIVFEPQPQEYLRPEKSFFRLTSCAEKLNLLKNLGVDVVLCLRFDATLAQLTGRYFIEQILVQKLRVRRVIIGDDFRFGAQGRGDAEFLQVCGERNNFSVAIVPPVSLNGVKISSSLVRQILVAGEVSKVGQLLGRPYSATGRVVHGKKLGQKLGFPTANVYLPHKELPFSGVFLVRVQIHSLGLGGKVLGEINPIIYSGVANVGFRPTFAEFEKQLEVFIFDFNKDIYHYKMTVEFLQKIRDEIKFPSMKLLQEQISADVKQARQLVNL